MSRLPNIPVWQMALHPMSIARMLWKQKLLVGVVWLLLSAVAVMFVARMPAVYRAETIIVVDSQKIPEKFVSATVSNDLRERLASLSQQILSSSHLLKIIETFDLYPKERRVLPIEEVLEIMRRHVQIRVEKGWTDEHPGAFRVSFEGENPPVLAEVVNQLGNLFVDENLRAREVHAASTSEFIQSQLEQAKRALDEQESRVSQYKLAHNGELPEQEAALTAGLSQLGGQLQGNRDAINRCYANQMTLQSEVRLAQTVAEVSERLSKSSEEAAHQGTGASESVGERPEKILASMEMELASLLTKFTEAHPRVRLLRASIARLRALEEKEKLAAAVDPAHTESLKAQLAALDLEIKEREHENRRLVQQIQDSQARLQRIPIREQEMAALTRDYEMSKANYKSLLDKLYAADMASDMERRQKAERFAILEPARVPERPVKPDRPLAAGTGSLLALAIGLAVGLFREIKRNRFLGEWEVPASIPVQGRVPTIGTLAPIRPAVRFRLQSGGCVDRMIRPVMNGAFDARTAVNGVLVRTPDVEEPRSPIFSTQLAASSASNSAQPLKTTSRRPVKSVGGSSAAVCLHNADPYALEQYRMVRTKIAYHPLQPKMIVVTSACSGDGKTISAVNLATVFALRKEVRVLLVEGDFRRSGLAQLLGLPPQPGIADVLTGKCDLNEALISLEQLPNLCVLPAGACAVNPAELLETAAWHSMCASFRHQFAFILLDAPPVAAVADYELIERDCDGVLMVARPDHTDRSSLGMALSLVSPDKMLGVLMNGTDDWFLWKAQESYYGYSKPVH
jgi:polysaccharide chain length determinant protein (PEP-CTERM system associated)